MADPPHRVPELSPFGHRRDLWGARLAYSSGVPIIEMVAKANISRIAQTDLVYRQAIPGEMQRVLPIIAWLLVRCSLSSMPSAAVEQRRSEPFPVRRSDEHTTEPQPLMRTSYADSCLTKKTITT